MKKLVIKENMIVGIKGTGIPKPQPNLNTDDILPARFLKEITFSNMGNYVFIDERYKDGKEVKEHPFNDPNYKGANILLAGENFGCGSSREHAPQGLHRFGIDAIVAGESMAEIFWGNCASLGVPGVTVSNEELAKVVDYVTQNPKSQLDIDLKKKMLTYGNQKVKFNIPEGQRESFVTGLWDVVTVLKHYEPRTDAFANKLDYLSFL